MLKYETDVQKTNFDQTALALDMGSFQTTKDIHLNGCVVMNWIIIQVSKSSRISNIDLSNLLSYF